MLEGVDSVEFGLVVAVTRVLDGDFTSHFVGSASVFHIMGIIMMERNLLTHRSRRRWL